MSQCQNANFTNFRIFSWHEKWKTLLLFLWSFHDTPSTHDTTMRTDVQTCEDQQNTSHLNIHTTIQQYIFKFAFNKNATFLHKYFKEMVYGLLVTNVHVIFTCVSPTVIDIENGYMLHGLEVHGTGCLATLFNCPWPHTLFNCPWPLVQGQMS